MTDLQHLVSKLAEAEGPDRELDAEIALASGWQHEEANVGKGRSGAPIIRHTWTSPHGKQSYAETTLFTRDDKFPEGIPYYTSSLDAKLPGESIYLTEYDFGACCWRAEHHEWARGALEAPEVFVGFHETSEAIARRIAALKAREQQ